MADRTINFEQSPVPGVDVEFIRHVVALPEEVRKGLGNFILDSTVKGFDGSPCPDNLHGYHCTDYFGDGWAERGFFHDASHCWVVKPLHNLHPEQRLGFFAVGEAGVDGIRFGYRHGERGLWAFYPIGEEFRFVAATLQELIDGWRAGTITV